jgi:hypothetical protein
MYAFGTTREYHSNQLLPNIYLSCVLVGNIIVLLGTSHVKYVEKLGAFLSVAVSLVLSSTKPGHRNVPSPGMVDSFISS